MNQSTDPRPSESTEPVPADLVPTRVVPEIPEPPETRSPQLPGGDATQAMPAKDPVPAPSRTSGRGWVLWLVLGLVGLGAAGAAAYGFLLRRTAPLAEQAESSANASTPEAIAPELRPYMDQAKAGDAKAMHMIALMYWNGLNVRQDRAKGLEWYRKAATAGSTAAQQFLKDNQLQ